RARPGRAAGAPVSGQRGRVARRLRLQGSPGPSADCGIASTWRHAGIETKEVLLPVAVEGGFRLPERSSSRATTCSNCHVSSTPEPREEPATTPGWPCASPSVGSRTEKKPETADRSGLCSLPHVGCRAIVKETLRNLHAAAQNKTRQLMNYFGIRRPTGGFRGRAASRAPRCDPPGRCRPRPEAVPSPTG